MSSRKRWHFSFAMKEKICAFFGHREIEYSEDLFATTTAEIIKAVDLGCRVFYFGGFGEFDALCYEALEKLILYDPTLHIKRIYCVTQERYLRKNSPHFDRKKYDEVVFLEPAFDGWYKSIYYRKCAMIDKSDVVIFYAENRENSGAYKAYKYAVKQKKQNYCQSLHMKTERLVSPLGLFFIC